jgi:hypothetical protein
MSDVHTWSTTASNNNSAAPNGWPEGMAASSLNNAGRELMAAVAKWYKDDNGTLVTAGSSNAYTLAPNRTVTAYEAGLKFTFEANHTSTSTTPTLNVSSLGAKTITNQEGDALTVGDIVSGGIYSVTYDGGEGKFKLISSFVTASGLVPFAYCRVDANGVLRSGSLNIASSARSDIGKYTVMLTAGVTDTTRTLTLVAAEGGIFASYYWESSTRCDVFTRSDAGPFNSVFSLLIYDTH